MYKFIIIKKQTLFLAIVIGITMLVSTVFISAASIGYEENEDERKVRLPIIMYHSVLKNPSSSGKYVVSPKTLEEDLKYLKENGYSAILTSELIEYVKNGGALPEKPVMITFDDGYLNNLTYAVPLLEKYDMKAIISVVGKYTERFSKEEDHNPNYSHFSWDDINECIASGRVEIGNHSYDMHNQTARKGTMKKTGESIEEYKKIFSEDVLKTQSLLMEHCNVSPKVFTYPYGAVSDASVDIVKELGFDMSLGCCEKVNEIKRDENALYLLCRFNRPGNMSTAEFMKKITQ